MAQKSMFGRQYPKCAETNAIAYFLTCRLSRLTYIELFVFFGQPYIPLSNRLAKVLLSQREATIVSHS